jgi:hypothetical protein
MSYALTKQDAVGVRYDQVRGDTNQNNLAFNYTRKFSFLMLDKKGPLGPFLLLIFSISVIEIIIGKIY